MGQKVENGRQKPAEFCSHELRNDLQGLLAKRHEEGDRQIVEGRLLREQFHQEKEDTLTAPYK